MSRFFFHVYDDDVTLDECGRELPDVAAARREALAGARSLMAEQVIIGRLCLDHRIEVEDEHRKPVLSLAFSAAIEIQGLT